MLQNGRLAGVKRRQLTAATLEPAGDVVTKRLRIECGPFAAAAGISKRIIQSGSINVSGRTDPLQSLSNSAPPPPKFPQMTHPKARLPLTPISSETHKEETQLNCTTSALSRCANDLAGCDVAMSNGSRTGTACRQQNVQRRVFIGDLV